MWARPDLWGEGLGNDPSYPICANLFSELCPAGKVLFELQLSGPRRFGQSLGHLFPFGEHVGEGQGRLDRPDDLVVNQGELAPGAGTTAVS